MSFLQQKGASGEQVGPEEVVEIVQVERKIETFKSLDINFVNGRYVFKDL
jgi:hypothetical protein